MIQSVQNIFDYHSESVYHSEYLLTIDISHSKSVITVDCGDQRFCVLEVHCRLNLIWSIRECCEMVSEIKFILSRLILFLLHQRETVKSLTKRRKECGKKNALALNQPHDQRRFYRIRNHIFSLIQYNFIEINLFIFTSIQ